MSARECFCAARDAAVLLRDSKSRLELMREKAVFRARSYEASSHGSFLDAMRNADALIEYEGSLGRETREAKSLVREAESLLAGLAQIDLPAARVLKERYLDLVPWNEVAEREEMPYDAVREIEQRAFDLIDANGIAAIREGRTPVTGAED